jgi:hypothetical protein
LDALEGNVILSEIGDSLLLELGEHLALGWRRIVGEVRLAHLAATGLVDVALGGRLPAYLRTLLGRRATRVGRVDSL